jgi:esterase/lipase
MLPGFIHHHAEVVTEMPRTLISATFFLLIATSAVAQDIQGIENCSAEKAMDRRTGCLQSNVNYLYQQLTKANADSRQRLDAANQKLDAANAEIAALKAAVAKLQATIEDLQVASKKPAEPKAK